MTESDNLDQLRQQLAYQHPLSQYGSSIVHLTNPEKQLFNVELQLRGQSIDENGERQQTLIPLLNDRGVSAMMTYLKALVNQVTILGNIDPKEIPQTMEYFYTALIEDLMINRYNYDIKSLSDSTRIHTVCCLFAKVTLDRARSEGDRRFWKGTQQEIRHHLEQEEKKRGILGFNFGGKE